LKNFESEEKIEGISLPGMSSGSPGMPRVKRELLGFTSCQMISGVIL